VHTVGELLRQWRQRRGLSQWDLAIAADVSARHVSLVETGKSRPSPDMILRLADQLHVPLRDRNRLLLAGGYAPRYPERALDDTALTVAHDAIRRVLRAHEPYPAIVFDRRWNIVMTNRAFEPFLAHAAPDLLRPPVNLIRLGLDPRGLAHLVVNITDVRAVFRSRISRQLATNPDPELAQIWSAKGTSSGSMVSVTNESWNASVPANGYVTFGFLASGSAAAQVGNLTCTTG
jgi:transcriptional regulator with XRE-family HTH domain